MTTSDDLTLAPAEAVALTPMEFPPELAPLAAETASRVQAVVDEMANRCLSPGKPGTPWAGRNEVCLWVEKTFGIEVMEASELVTSAETELWSQNHEDDTHVQRELALSRYRLMRRRLLQEMDKPQIERRWVYKTDKDGVPVKDEKGNFTAMPLREKVIHGPNPAMYRLSLAVEQAITDLMVHRSHQRENTVEELLESRRELPERADGTVVTSVTRVRSSSVYDKLSEEGKARVARQLGLSGGEGSDEQESA